MKKYRVYGNVNVVVTKEVWAYDEADAKDRAWSELSSLTAFCGNGGVDKLIGVYEHDESVEADGCIEWDDTELLEDDPDYFPCPECGEECEKCSVDNGDIYYHCGACGKDWDEDGDETWFDEEDEVDE